MSRTMARAMTRDATIYEGMSWQPTTCLNDCRGRVDGNHLAYHNKSRGKSLDLRNASSTSADYDDRAHGKPDVPCPRQHVQ